MHWGRELLARQGFLLRKMFFAGASGRVRIESVGLDLFSGNFADPISVILDLLQSEIHIVQSGFEHIGERSAFSIGFECVGGSIRVSIGSVKIIAFGRFKVAFVF
jgi:hypothetical protein